MDAWLVHVNKSDEPIQILLCYHITNADVILVYIVAMY